MMNERQYKLSWILSFYGTAVGAGTLFLPIEAGLHGLLPLCLMLVLAWPMTYLSHRALCRLVLSSKAKSSNITNVVEEDFGHRAGIILTFLYFFAIFPILLMYSVGMTNTMESFITHQTAFSAPPRALLAFVLIAALLGVIRCGQEVILKVMGYLVYPFVTALMFLAFYLMPFWNDAMLQTLPKEIVATGPVVSVWLMIPVIVFSFNFSPIISSFAVSQKQRYSTELDEKSARLLKYSSILMFVTVMFFVLSCVLALSPSNLIEARQENISILSYLANHMDRPLLAFFGPLIAFIAITKSFLGHYLGAKEGLIGLYNKVSNKPNNTITSSKTMLLIELFLVLFCWIVATLNPNILKLIETVSGPAIALVLFLLPMYAMVTVPTMRKYRSFWSDAFITVMGLIAVSAMFYGIFHAIAMKL